MLTLRVDPDRPFYIVNRKNLGIRKPYGAAWISALAQHPDQFEIAFDENSNPQGVRPDARPDQT